MIFKLAHLEGIKAGTITLAFRKWKKPTVRKGSRLRNEFGVIEITDVSETDVKEITRKDAGAAGFESIDDLLKVLRSVEEGAIYRIKLRYLSEDPRIALRKQTSLTEKGLLTLQKKLDRLDNASREGKWTIEILKAIRDHPELRAADLARRLKKEKDWLKINIRKLKNLGLTISHEIGYSISPLGKYVLEKLE
jgi:hypothetical protein